MDIYIVFWHCNLNIFSPCRLPGCLSWASSTDENETLAFVKKARQDWETILLNRAKELCNGEIRLYNMFSPYLFFIPVLFDTGTIEYKNEQYLYIHIYSKESTK